MSAASPAGRTAGGLNRETILREALSMVDRDGAQSLSMRRLGASLGVEAMSLYHHVPNKDALIAGLAELLLGELPVARANQPWPHAVRAFAIGIREAAAAHPAAFTLIGMRPLSAEIASRPAGSLVQKLHRAGLDPAAAVAAFRLVAIFSRGFALAEISGFTLADPSLPHFVAGELAPFAAALANGRDAAFSRALEVVVQGIAAQLPPAS